MNHVLENVVKVRDSELREAKILCEWGEIRSNGIRGNFFFRTEG